ncbi:hypothetical protein KBD81_06425 [Candidatus Woesebacteria bacterium]|nr:hypothetical protein [Candidatus Woesebacteria bacterium]
MKRETIIAIVFGILLGAAAGVVVLFQTKSKDAAKVIPIDSNQKKVITPMPVASTSAEQLVISKPGDRAIVSEKSITITGTAPINALIIAQSPTSEQILKNEKEQFSVTMPLALGENVINISVYAGSGTPQEQVLRIYYVPSP